MASPNMRKGSSKMVYPTCLPGRVEFVDSGDTSLFDLGAIPGFNSGLIARARIKQALGIFRWLERHGVPTHLIAPTGSGVSFIAQECRIGTKPLLSGVSEMRHTNLEVLVRNEASEKFLARVERGEVETEDLHLSTAQLEVGVPFKCPFVEASSKWDSVDVYKTKAEAAVLAGLPMGLLGVLYAHAGQDAEIVFALFRALGYRPIDLKLEYAYNELSGQFILIDATTLDECGVMKDGEWYGKNPLRFWYKEQHPKWYAQLTAAQKAHPNDKSQWPTYPCPLPDDLKRAHELKNIRFADELQRYMALHT